MVLKQICPPALIYLVFSITQVVIDTIKGMYTVAFIKIWVALIFAILLNFLCNRGLGIISWLIVFVPFILMSIIVTLLLVMFGLDPLTGRRPRRVEPSRRHRRHHGHQHHERRHHHKHNRKHHHHRYDDSKDSSDKALRDAVRNRAGLNTDPLQTN
tara:strand:- start:35 stop:502 length:468 start_codon:yes stop_codon:yes gene_type:complete